MYNQHYMNEETKGKIIIPVEFEPDEAMGVPEPPKDLKDGDNIWLLIDGELVRCVFRDFSSFNFDPRTNKEIRTIIKIQPSAVVVAKGGEKVTTTRDGITTERIAKPGQMLVKNVKKDGKTEDQYIFGNEVDDVATQIEKFFQSYQEVGPETAATLWKKFPHLPPETRFYRKRPIPLAGIKVTMPTAIKSSWGDIMGTPAGGYVTEAGYTISPASMADFYQVTELSELMDDQS